MEKNRNQHITSPDPQKRKNGPVPGNSGYDKQLKETRNAQGVSHGDGNASAGSETNERQPDGEWVHPITNQDEQRKTTNASNNDIMGEKETEGV